MLATPGLPAGSALAPPVKAKSSATTGTEGSRTSQALMPPGEVIAWILLAASAAPNVAKPSATPQQRAEDPAHDFFSSRGARASRLTR